VIGVVTKLQVFFAPGPSWSSEVAAKSLAAEVHHLRERVPWAQPRAVIDAGLLGSDSTHASETAGGPVFTALLEVAAMGDHGADDLVPVVAGLADRCGPWLAPDRSAAVFGTEHVIVAGDEPLMLAMALQRRADLSSEEFHDYWLTKHAALGRAVPGSQGYRQLHADPELSRQAATSAGVGGHDFEGVAIAFYADEPAFFAIMGNTEVTEPLMADEQKFIDHARSAMVIGYAPQP
jgi:hypothetical protein